jgi:NhaP-type Na+/H+ or K+/H+ antiporter
MDTTREQAIVTVAFGVAALSMFVQELTMTPLLRKLKEML